MGPTDACLTPFLGSYTTLAAAAAAGLHATTFGVVGSPFSPSGQFLALLRFPPGAEGRVVGVGGAPGAGPLPFADVITRPRAHAFFFFTVSDRGGAEAWPTPHERPFIFCKPPLKNPHPRDC